MISNYAHIPEEEDGKYGTYGMGYERSDLKAQTHSHTDDPESKRAPCCGFVAIEQCFSRGIASAGVDNNTHFR